jgi:hypothetical protein
MLTFIGKGQIAFVIDMLYQTDARKLQQSDIALLMVVGLARLFAKRCAVDFVGRFWRRKPAWWVSEVDQRVCGVRSIGVDGVKTSQVPCDLRTFTCSAYITQTSRTVASFQFFET